MMNASPATYESAPPASERRRAERLHANLTAHWEGVIARRSATLVDLSVTGCFLLTSDQGVEDDLVRVEIEMLDGRSVFLWGEVVYRIAEMGFALRFTGTNAEEQAALDDLLLDLRARQVLEKS